MHITHISVVSLPVGDQEEAKKFYTEKLDFAVLQDDTFGDQRWIQLAPPNAQTSITLVAGQEHMPSGSQKGVILAFKNIQADHEVLRARGVEISDLEMAPWGMSATFSDSHCRSVLEQFGLEDAADRLVRTYSGGMRRRSLVSSPQLLLLDEPTIGLDPRSRSSLWSSIRKLVQRGTDVLLTTQYLDEADQLAHHIIIIDQGRVIAEGTSQELKARVGGDVIEVHIRNEDRITDAANVLENIGQGEPFLDLESLLVSATVNAGPEQLRAVIHAFAEADIELEDISLRRPSLDEVFLALTGQPIHDEQKTTADTESIRMSLEIHATERDGAGLLTSTWIFAKRSVLKTLRTPQIIFFSTVTG